MTHLICWKRALVVGTALAGLASPAWAQTAQEGAAASEQAQAEDIIVTANRRDQSDLSVGAAVTPLSAEMLEATAAQNALAPPAELGPNDLWLAK